MSEKPMHAFLCPITEDIMSDPVCTADGHTYERAAIERWLARSDNSPSTGARLPSKALVPNFALKQAVAEWDEAYALHLRRADIEIEPQPFSLRSITGMVVYKGKLRVHAGGPSRELPVEVLRLRSGEGATEAGVLSRLGRHPRLVRFLGQCVERGERLLLTELAELGSLTDVLVARDGRLTGAHNLVIMQQVAQGMEHLAEQGIIHCALSARNLRIFGFDAWDVRRTSVKVAVFGLATSSCGRSHVTLEPGDRHALSVRFLSEEALVEGRFSECSAVWAFGVTCWEVLTLGALPYSDLAEDRVAAHVCGGGRLQRDQIVGECDEELWELISRCWAKSPEDRPRFSELTVALGGLGHVAAGGGGAATRTITLPGLAITSLQPPARPGMPHFSATARSDASTMEVVVKMLTGKTCVVTCRPADTVRELKGRLQRLTGIPDLRWNPEQQLLVRLACGERLEDALTLADYAIGPGSVLSIALSHVMGNDIAVPWASRPLRDYAAGGGATAQVAMQVFVRMDTGRMLSLIQKAGDTVRELKQHVQSVVGAPPCKQYIVFLGNGKVLKDKYTLADYDILPGSTILSIASRLPRDGAAEGGGEVAITRMEIFVRSHLRERPWQFPLLCNSHDTVGELKAQIQEVEGIPPNEQLLVLQGLRRSICLENKRRTLALYDIHQGSVLDLVQITPEHYIVSPMPAPLSPPTHVPPAPGAGQGGARGAAVPPSLSHPSNPMQIVVIDMISDKECIDDDGGKIPVTCLAGDTVYSVKSRLQDKVGREPESLNLIWGGSFLKDERTLADYQVPPGATMFLSGTKLTGNVAIFRSGLPEQKGA